MKIHFPPLAVDVGEIAGLVSLLSKNSHCPKEEARLGDCGACVSSPESNNSKRCLHTPVDKINRIESCEI